MPARGREVRYLVKLYSASDTYFYAYAVPREGEIRRRYRFPACEETNDVDCYRVLPNGSSSIWRGSRAREKWKLVTSCGWCPIAVIKSYKPLTTEGHHSSDEEGAEPATAQFETFCVPTSLSNCPGQGGQDQKVSPAPPLDLHRGLRKDVIVALACNPAPDSNSPPGTKQPNIPDPYVIVNQIEAKNADKGKAAETAGATPGVTAGVAVRTTAGVTAGVTSGAISGNAVAIAGTPEVTAGVTVGVTAGATAGVTSGAISGAISGNAVAIAGSPGGIAGGGGVAAATTIPHSAEGVLAAKLLHKECAPSTVTLTRKKAAGGGVSATASHKQACIGLRSKTTAHWKIGASRPSSAADDHVHDHPNTFDGSSALIEDDTASLGSEEMWEPAAQVHRTSAETSPPTCLLTPTACHSSSSQSSDAARQSEGRGRAHRARMKRQHKRKRSVSLELPRRAVESVNTLDVERQAAQTLLVLCKPPTGLASPSQKKAKGRRNKKV